MLSRVRALAATVLIGLLALPAAAYADGPHAQVVGGTQAAPGEYPAQAFVDNGLASCGGSLMAPTKVLTAAHCVTFEGTTLDIPAPSFHLCLGQTNISSCQSANTYGVSSVEHNASYDASSARSDVALLTLNRPAPFTPLPLAAPSPQPAAPGVNARIIGWGQTSESGSTSNNLLKADVPIVSDAQCDTDYQAPRSGSEQFDSATMICAGDGTHDTCAGDSGGPMMVSDGARLVLIGVTSWGEGCARMAFPGVYARVGSEPLNGWVRARIATTPPPPPPPPADVTPPVLHLALPGGQRLRGALKRGLKLRFRCSEACKLSASLSIARKTSKRLHLRQKVSSRSAQLPANARRTLTLKFSKRTRKKLSSARRLTLKLSVVATDGSGNPHRATRHIRLRR
jgi:secreted trypsin-like serine protease